MVLSLCGSAFAAEEQLTVTSETVRNNNTVRTTYWYKNAEGTLVRIYAEIFTLSGARLGEELIRFDEEERAVYQRETGMQDGVWKNEETNTTYMPDGTQTYESHIAWNYPGSRKESAVIHGTADAEGYKSETREQFDTDVAWDEKRYDKVLDSYAKPRLLIIDEWLAERPDSKDLHAIKELIHRRRRKSSTIFCSQILKEGWYHALGGEDTEAEAILDRITYDGYDINIEYTDPEKAVSMRKIYSRLKPID